MSPASLRQAEAEEGVLGPLLHARYRDGAGWPAAANPVLEALLGHRSVRAYLPDPIPEGALETAVAAAQSAPSSSNLQVWSVVAVADPERKARLSELSGRQQHILEAPLFLVWLIDFDRLTQLTPNGDPCCEALDYTETFLLGAIDTALAAQNAVVALESLGLGTVYTGGIRNHPLEVAAELSLPPGLPAVRPGGRMARSGAPGGGEAQAAADVGAVPGSLWLGRGPPCGGRRLQPAYPRLPARTGHGREGLDAASARAHPRPLFHGRPPRPEGRPPHPRLSAQVAVRSAPWPRPAARST